MRLSTAVVVCSLLGSACEPVAQKHDTGQAEPAVDADGDGYDREVDCDDEDPQRHPGADEVCDGLDNDCDGFLDDEDPSLVGGASVYLDGDGDGYGDAASAVGACSAPDGYVDDGSDCDDADAAINPGALEICNDLDDDCDGLVDDDDEVSGATTWYVDADGDGFGDQAVTTRACSMPSGYSADDTDCDDGDQAVNPSAAEACNGFDDDCDGLVDDDDRYVIGTTTWYADSDGDGYGDVGRVAETCVAPSGFVADFTDCHDSVAAINPGASELCNGLDDDCDGLVDDDDSPVSGTTTWYADSDGDGYGDAAVGTSSCAAPSGFVSDAGDCDDTAAAINPGASELCNGLDDDCDGLVDDDDSPVSGTSTWYADSDGDGYGSAVSSVAACLPLRGFVADSSDCHDGDPAVNPGASEVCNSLDDDCDGLVDDDDSPVSGTSTWYADADGDGYGDVSVTTGACGRPAGHVGDASDCDDGDGAINPAAGELCNGVDDDCDGLVDDDDSPVSGTSTWYTDADGDGYGNPVSGVAACLAPSGTVADSSDCHDGDGGVNPDAKEVCNGADDDCDGLVDDADPGLTGGSVWYLDGDWDGYGDAGSSAEACMVPSGYVGDATDCDDGDPDINPGASEACNGLDDDCDGTVDSAAACPCNVKRRSGHVYLFCEDVATWWEAWEGCNDLDSYDLVTIDDASENAWVFARASAYGSEYIWWWIGYNDIGAAAWQEPAAGWEWSDGSSSSYTNWNSGQPDDWRGDEDCAHIYGDYEVWNDLDCDSDSWNGSYWTYYICESG
jgi:hypothetical protein